MPLSYRSFAVAAMLMACTSAPAAAQGVRCSAFLHERDGSWRSFESGVILLPRGPVRVATGERFRHGSPSAKDYIARLLDQTCQPLD